MALFAPKTTDLKFTPAPSGTHVARCVGIYELGKQKVVFQEAVSYKHKIRFTFELPKCLMTEGDMRGSPYTVSANYTLSLHKQASLRSVVEGWLNNKFTEDGCATFDITTLLGKDCVLNIVHNGKEDKVYANIFSVNAPMDGMECPPAVNRLVLFEIGNHTQEEFESLPEWLRNKINLEGSTSTPDAQGSGNTEAEYAEQKGTFQDLEEEIPFN